MSDQIKLGKWMDDGAAEIDLARLMETRALIQANSGGGKSWKLRRLLEQTAGKVQQIVIDPEGEFASLREKHDLIIAAPHGGDALAHPKTAKLLAERLLETRVSAVLDIYDLKRHDREEFVKRFMEALMSVPKHLYGHVLIVLDEAQLFSPEKGSGESQSTAAVIDVATRGRKRGYALVCATQRISKLSKDVAAELLNKFVGRTGLDLDVKRAAFELGMTPKEALAALQHLEDGQFYAYGPAISKTVRLMKSGSVATTHPKVGDRTLRAPPKPTAAIRAILPKLADLPKEAEQEAKTVDELRQEVARLKREAASKTGNVDVTAVREKAYAEGLIIGKRESLKHAAVVMRTIGDDIAQMFSRAVADNRVAQLPENLKPKIDTSLQATTATQARAAPTAKVTRAEPPSGELSGPEQRIVDAIAWLATMTGREDPVQTAVAFMANYTIGAGSFNNPRGSLKVKGFVEYLGDRIRLTDAGRALARAPDVPLTEEELQRRVLDRLGGPEQRVLKPLIDAYPNPMDGPDLAAAAGYAFGAGSFNNPRGRLKTLGLVEYVGDGRVVAASCLFPGRP